MDRETKERLKNQILYHRPLTNEEMGIKPGQESQILQISLSITALVLFVFCLLKCWGWW